MAERDSVERLAEKIRKKAMNQGTDGVYSGNITLKLGTEIYIDKYKMFVKEIVLRGLWNNDMRLNGLHRDFRKYTLQVYCLNDKDINRLTDAVGKARNRIVL